MSGCTEEEKPAWRALSILPQGHCEAFFWTPCHLSFSTPTILPASNILRNSNT